jgi:putative ABC transport system ATP-binding protein
MDEAFLRVSELSFTRAAVDEESGFTLEVPSLTLLRGEAVAVVGPSGCGKSTLIDVLALLRRPHAVRCFELLGEDMAALWERGGADACSAFRAERIGVVLQTGGLLPSLTVWENVTLSQQLLDRSDAAWARSLLEALDLATLGARLPAQLSIGQRQRVAVARALAHRPALVLADEPTAALGMEHASAALDLLLTIGRAAGAALVIASHDKALLHAHGVPLLDCVCAGNLTRFERVSWARPDSVLPS